MATKRVLVLALLCVVLLAILGWRMGWMSTTPAPTAVAPTPTPTPPPRFQSAWATEEEWLADRIAGDVAGTGAFASGRAVPAPPKTDPLQAGDHLFSPRVYEAIAREALGEAPAAHSTVASEAREDARVLSALLDLRAAVLLREDVALSRQLETAPRDAAAHERAALLLGAFALRDGAGRSTDTRPALTRMTAHLAVARALRRGAEAGLAGRVAEAVLATLVGRQKDALARLEGLEAAAARPEVKAWVRALRLRNTGDWRIALTASRLHLLERLEEFRALVQGQGDTAALAWLDQGRPEAIPDWGLVALGAWPVSVESGNRYADLSIMMELAEAREVLSLLRRVPDDEAGFLDALNERPGRLVSRDAQGRIHVAVLGWGLWADRIQRDLVFELMMGEWVLSQLMGQPGEAQAFAERARSRFGRLEMYPLVLRGHASDAEHYRTGMAAVRELALRSPERLTGGHWHLIRAKEEFAPLPRDLPDENTWFRPALPSGTVFDTARRLEVLQELRAIGAEDLRALREQAPYDVALARFAAARQPADQASIYGPLADFDVGVMGKLADAAWYDPPRFRERQGALCEAVPEKCFLLGYRLAEMGFAEEAAVVYQKGFDRANDRVTAANESRWLVDYYFDHGQARKAEAVATAAAAVYSERGLFAMANLMERMGRLREAEEYYRRILDRYENANDLAGFYYRQARAEKKAEYEAKLRDALARVMPTGLEPLDRASLPASPTDGVVVKEENDNTKRFGIKWGNVIVGLDGFRVRDLHAYDAVSALSHSPLMKLVVWNGRSYSDVEAELWDRRFRIALETLAPKP